MMLHNMDERGSGMQYGDTLSPDGERLPKADLIITNPPFGTKQGGGLPTREDFTVPNGKQTIRLLTAYLQSIKTRRPRRRSIAG